MTLGIFAQGKVEWIDWGDLEIKMQESPRKIMVHLYKETCHWCKELEEDILNQEDISSYLNIRYYPIRLNVNHDRNIRVNQRVYKSSAHGNHELVQALTQGNVSLPMIIFIDNRYNVIQAFPGRQKSEKFIHILKYFGDDHYLRVPWNRYMATKTNYKSDNNHGHFTNQK